MPSFKEQMAKLRELRREQPTAAMVPGLGLPRLMVVGFAIMLALALFQAFTKNNGKATGTATGSTNSQGRPVAPTSDNGDSTAQTSNTEVPYRVFISPGDDLTGLDERVLLTATHTVDMATAGEMGDQACRAVAIAAKRGVQVRLVRDAEGFAAEQVRAGGSCSANLVQVGVAVRVVKQGRLMLHSYSIDGRRLRSGTAMLGGADVNAGEDVEVIASEAVVEEFELAFTTLWNDPENRVVREANLLQ